MIKPASIISALVLLLSCGQSENAQTKSKNDSSYSYSLPTPKGWTIEQFPIPISFARSIKYKGVEEIRFAPGFSHLDRAFQLETFVATDIIEEDIIRSFDSWSEFGSDEASNRLLIEVDQPAG